MIMQLLRKLRFPSAEKPAFSVAVTARIDRVLEELRFSEASVKCNLGCGGRYHPDWINVDFHGDGDVVFACDLRGDLPFPEKSCDVVYSSHVIEHFDRFGAGRFLHECRRVLKSGGIIRLVAPDLEGIVRSYLYCLEAAKRGESGADAKYEWAVIELLDQLVRHQSGGEILKHWCQPVVPAEAFVAERVGTEYWRARKQCKDKQLSNPDVTDENVGKFRLGGEVHQWMYDRYSLGKLLTDFGFVDVRICLADESAIQDFAKYHLDTEPDGTLYKPDSFFIEAVAP
jgi:SAM-dependent methyltransferase